MKYKLLGSVEILDGSGVPFRPTAAKICQVLGLLLIRDEVTSVDLIIRELWGDDPPRSAMTTLQTYIYHARKMFEQKGMADSENELLVTQPPGYALRVKTEDIDAKVFEGLVADARSLLLKNRPEEASRRLTQALDLWRGPALANITPGDVLRGHITYLDELKIMALELRIEAEKARGRARELIPELRSLVAAYPLNEWFHRELIQGLFAAGRRAESLAAYQNLTAVLREELGVEPAPELQRLRHQIITSNQVVASTMPAGLDCRSA
ncbi:AfsR/SARP family transcriptional regulator [Nocardia transvalensis]|uniref:AfsR/SARP family transcriptional regulator n=1 Tax=Nocardia transvalensis TaxID=37333 RepID=UPI0018937F64|nr:AfsR/SARP family transcriptional regulator [Nocardia transvalensis]MBF6328251.1 AfsR/SARP family transcriptional regulator [Nocardia transvalensis]